VNHAASTNAAHFKAAALPHPYNAG